MRKLQIFERIYRQILRAYAYIWSKNLTINTPERVILSCKWNFQRSLLNLTALLFLPLFLTAEMPWGKDSELTKTIIHTSSETLTLPIILIEFHQNIISPADGPRSHFIPSSSQYTKQAMQKYGFFKGWLLGCDRLMRENDDEWIYPKITNPEGIKMKWDPVK